MKDINTIEKVMVPMGVRRDSWGTRKCGRDENEHDGPWKLNIHLQRTTSMIQVQSLSYAANTDVHLSAKTLVKDN